MSRKDYIAIAAALRDERETAVALFEPYHAAGIAVAARAVAKVLARDNARFDLDRFLQACGVEEDA